ncbi:MAG: neuraminidase-like domain-containing protein, partial [Gammaproteobacteria bacterium]
MDESKLDRIHRFLRLWRKLKGWKMWELDLVIRHPHIGNGALDEAFLVGLFYFSQLRNRLGGKTTVEQVCALFGDLNTETRFTKLHEKREDALYQSLFLNKRLINPLDPAFQLDPGTGDLPTGENITAHHPAILAALGIREADLILFKELAKASDGTRYITDDLTLSHLSFVWRHSWPSKLLKFKAEEWKTILKIFQQDILQFAGPEVAWKFVEGIDRLKITGFTPDELNWLLAADRSAKAAVKEADAARFLAALRKDLQAIQAEFDPAQYDFLTVTPPTDVDGLTALLTSLLQKLNRDEAATQFFIATLRDEVTQETVVAGLPAGFDFPAAIKSTIRIRYDEPATTLRFTGLMTAAERTTLLTDASLAAVTGIAAYQEAIERLFISPRLALKFFEPVFTASLAKLPAAVDFRSLSDAALALKISYDAEQHLLRFAGILSKDEKAALDALSGDAAYRNAVNSLFTQPVIGVFPPEQIWLLDADLQFPLHDLTVPANDHLADNLATAATKALAYLSKALSENAVVQQCSTQLGLTEALTRRLLTQYALLPDTLMTHLTGAFVATTGVVDYATLKTTFDGWFWASRAATILNKWKITLAELEKITALTTGAQLLDLLTLPLDASGAIASIDRFIRTWRLLRLRDTLPETEITLLEVLGKSSAGAYPSAAHFAADVQRLNEAWLATDVEALTASLDLSYPADYLLAESWERLRRAFYFLDNLNAGASTAKTFAAAAMTDTHAKAIKELLRSKFGTDTWLTLSAEIQDVLREGKRDALAAYLLTQPKPADAPSGKWENANDLFAYYLLDVEMSSCQLTSRLVQGSGSIQLFVQRCFMGLEPDIEVRADGDNGDSAWRWWKWMRKYRVWEANRKVFLWPENWIDPELKKDRSSFFKDLENELLQNEINQYSVETAFSNYLEKLDGVAQLEIAGFYHEDDGDNAIIHVFGRTKAADPHL